MSQKVSIIIPVYNVEPYLRECLDSVVNQTLRDIQILCVNDGSTDGSLAILEEYAAKDARITIINQENQGGGAARNNAIPFIRGKYTFFADSDDWLRLDLCEKVYQRAEETGVDAVYFLMKATALDTHSPKFNALLPKIRIASEERTDLLLYFTATWAKVWRSDFLKANEVRFFKGPYDDVLPSWRGTVLAHRIAILDEALYCRRERPGSYQQTLNSSHYLIIDTMDEIEMMLCELNRHSEYRNIFHCLKLAALRRTYLRFSYKYRHPFREMIRNALTDNDRLFLRTASAQQGLSKKVKLFYKAIENQSCLGRLNLRLLETISLVGRWSRAVFFIPIKHFFARLFKTQKDSFPKIRSENNESVENVLREEKPILCETKEKTSRKAA